MSPLPFTSRRSGRTSGYCYCQALHVGIGTFGLHHLATLGASTGAGLPIGSCDGFSCLVGGDGRRRTIGRDSGFVGGSRTIGDPRTPHETIDGRVVGRIIGRLEGRATSGLELFRGTGEETTLCAASNV